MFDMDDNTPTISSNQLDIHDLSVNDGLKNDYQICTTLIAPCNNYTPVSLPCSLKLKALKKMYRRKLRHKIKYRYSRLYRRYTTYIKHLVKLTSSNSKKVEVAKKEMCKPMMIPTGISRMSRSHGPISAARLEFYRRIAIIKSLYNKFPIIRSRDNKTAFNTVAQPTKDKNRPILIETPFGLDVRFNLSILIDILSCSLCKGLFYNAHTIKECMHTFCKSCLVLSTFQNGLVCPVCFIGIHSDINEAIEYDRNIQSLVDKVFPEFSENERKQKMKMDKYLRGKLKNKRSETIDYSIVQDDRRIFKNHLVNSTKEFLRRLLEQPENIGKLFDNVLCLALIHESDNELEGLFKNLEEQLDEAGFDYPEHIQNFPRKYVCVPRTMCVSHLTTYLLQELSLDPEYNVVFMIKNVILSRNHTVEFICKSRRIDMSNCVILHYKVVLETHH